MILTSVYTNQKRNSLNLSEFARVRELSRTTVYKYIKMVEN